MIPKISGLPLRSIANRYPLHILFALRAVLLTGLFLYLVGDSGKSLPVVLTILVLSSALLFILHNLTKRTRASSRQLAIAKETAKSERDQLDASNRKIRATSRIHHKYAQATSQLDQEFKHDENAVKKSRADKLRQRQSLEAQSRRLKHEFDGELLTTAISAKSAFPRLLAQCVAADTQANRIKPRYCKKQTDPKVVSQLTSQAEMEFGDAVDRLVSQLSDPETEPQPQLDQ